MGHGDSVVQALARPRVSLQVSAAVGDKAVALVDAGRVTLHSMTSATVRGAHGTYEVRAHKGGGFTCTCPARGAHCSHVAAASLAWAAAIQATQPRGATSKENDA